MRTYEEYHAILELWERGFNKKQIASLTGIPRGTIIYSIEKFGNLEGLANSVRAGKERSIETITEPWTSEHRKHYAYLLAAYLGDGCVSKVRNTFRLRIACDSKYPGIIQRLIEAIPYFCPHNSVNVVKIKNSRGVELTCYSNLWIILFPQHGSGRKHNRKIALETWQQEIVEEYPVEFLRGLIHTDGSRFEPVIYNRVYSRYQFTNRSEDILSLFCSTCRQLGISWTRWGPNLVIARRKDVELLDREIGPKS